MKLLWSLRTLLKNVIFIACFMLGCTSPNPTPLLTNTGLQERAQIFLTAYYREANLQKALELASGFAAQKIKDELALGGGQASVENISSREVSFSHTDSPADEKTDKRSILLYQLTIRSKSMEPITRIIRLTLEDQSLKSDSSDWKVVNFVES